MASLTDIFGIWKIIDLEPVSESGKFNDDSIVDEVEFCLEESGEVTWLKRNDTSEFSYLFNCELFELTDNKHSSAFLKFTGSFTGETINFLVDHIDDSTLRLRYDPHFVLKCQKVKSADSSLKIPFHFKDILNDPVFSDLTVKAADGSEVYVSSVILYLTCSNENSMKNIIHLLESLSSSSVEAVLYFIYAECLPPDLSEECAKMIVKKVDHKRWNDIPFTKQLLDYVERFLRSNALKKQIEVALDDVRVSIENTIRLFGGNPGKEGIDHSLVHDQVRLIYVCKQSLKEFMIVVTKLLVLCDSFTKRKEEMSKEERYDVIKFCKSRIAVLLNPVQQLMVTVRTLFDGLSQSQRMELASLLLPEIEIASDLIARYVTDAKEAMDSALHQGRQDESSSERPRSSIRKTLSAILHLKKLKKLKTFQDKAGKAIRHMMDARQKFSQRNNSDKVSRVAKYIESMPEELSLVIEKLYEFVYSIDHRVSWKDFKFMFKLLTSNMSLAIEELVQIRDHLRPILDEIVSLVDREEFTLNLRSLGLVDGSAADATLNIQGRFQATNCDSLFVSPSAHRSENAKYAVELLRNGLFSDVICEVVEFAESGDVVVDWSHGAPVQRVHDTPEVTKYEFHLHSAILAARCSWFRRALSSGMRESIDKKIQIHDTDPSLFRTFVEFLYSGTVDLTVCNIDQLSGLLEIADRFESDEMKRIIEYYLRKMLDVENGVYILGIADQFNVAKLKEDCLQFIGRNPASMDSEFFAELPPHLKDAVSQAVRWAGPRRASESSSIGSSPEELSSPFQITRNLSETSDVDDLRDAIHELSFQHDERLQQCISQLEEIMGDSVNREDLVRAIIAADFDLNRALNFLLAGP